MQILYPFKTTQWHELFSEQEQRDSINALESGKIIYFPELGFKLKEEEHTFLSPDYADPKNKNINYLPLQKKLRGIRNLNVAQQMQLITMLDRYYSSALQFVKNLFPRYANQLIIGRTSFRPVQISDRVTSKRKDDKRLHVDAFPASPNQGKRILRVFCNINPHGENRVWRVGEPFEKVVKQFLPTLSKPIPGLAALLRGLKITKSHRTLYDHFMLQLHDHMKKNDVYQKSAEQTKIQFPSGSTWIVQTDHVSHAAMQGQYVLEQTFYLPVQAMQNESFSPLRVLEKMLGCSLT